MCYNNLIVCTAALNSKHFVSGFKHFSVICQQSDPITDYDSELMRAILDVKCYKNKFVWREQLCDRIYGNVFDIKTEWKLDIKNGKVRNIKALSRKTSETKIFLGR